MSAILPEDFGAIGDGSTDDTGALQSWLNAIPSSADGVGYGPPGTYCFTQLVVRSNTTIRGAGSHRFVLKCISAKPGAAFANEHILGGEELGRLDHDIAIFDTGIVGVRETPIPPGSGIDFIVFAGIDRLTLERCYFADRQLDLIVYCNNVDMRVNACEFARWGKAPPFNHAPGQYVGGCALFGWRPSWNVFITDNVLRDSPGGLGIWLPVVFNLAPEAREATDFVVTGNQIRTVAEAGIVAAPRRSVVTGNIICDARAVDPSGHGAEIHGETFVYGLNVHDGADRAGAYVSNSVNAALPSNVFAHCDRLGASAAAVIVASHGPWAGLGPHAPRRVSVTGTVADAPYGVQFVDMGGGALTEILAADNNCGAVEFAGKRRKSIVSGNL